MIHHYLVEEDVPVPVITDKKADEYVPETTANEFSRRHAGNGRPVQQIQRQ